MVPPSTQKDEGTDKGFPQIVAKHQSYAFYHPFTEALAGIVADLPIKFCLITVFNIILYFLAGLRTEPSQFFIFFLFNFMAMMTMSAIFRTTAAVTKQISQALAIAGVMVLWIVIYTGFSIQRSYMHPWFRWTSWINPVGETVLLSTLSVYSANFQKLMHSRDFLSMKYMAESFLAHRQALYLPTEQAITSFVRSKGPGQASATFQVTGRHPLP